MVYAYINISQISNLDPLISRKHLPYSLRQLWTVQFSRQHPCLVMVAGDSGNVEDSPPIDD
jgi:hypothetical protein